LRYSGDGKTLIEVGTFFFGEHGLDIVLSFWRIVIFLHESPPYLNDEKCIRRIPTRVWGSVIPNKLPGGTNAAKRNLGHRAKLALNYLSPYSGDGNRKVDADFRRKN